MRRYVGPMAIFSICCACLSAAEVKGTVVDPSGAPVGGAQVSIVSRLGVEAQTVTSAAGAFELQAAPRADAHLVITAPGFRTATLPVETDVSVKLALAPVVDSVGVAGSTVDVSASQQGSSVDIVPREEIRTRNEPYAMDLLRYIPGMEFNQSGSAGGVSSLFLRGGDSDYTLVEIDGTPVNTFGGAFDFAHIPSEALDRIDVVRGPQSAVYGSYANSGAVDFITRQPGAAPQFDVLAEGGTYGGSPTRASRCTGCSIPITSANPGHTGPTPWTTIPASTPSAARRITSASMAAIMRSTCRGACARNCSAACSWRTAATPAPTVSATTRNSAGKAKPARW